jgi:hypothetical protein
MYVLSNKNSLSHVFSQKINLLKNSDWTLSFYFIRIGFFLPLHFTVTDNNINDGEKGRRELQLLSP